MNHDVRIVPLDGRPHLPPADDSQRRAWSPGGPDARHREHEFRPVAAFSARIGASGREYGSAEHLRQ
jgi:hypothetical protein